jgi:proteasome lid subunit RPN8/RPN11
MLVLGAAERMAIAEDAGRHYPGECCGFLLGSRAGGQAVVTVVLPAPNARADAPRDRFAIAPELLLVAQRAAEARRLEIVGFYHSHPDGGPDPSRLDREHAWPGHSYVIIGVSAGAPGAVRSWRLAAADGEFVEEPLGERLGPPPG